MSQDGANTRNKERAKSNEQNNAATNAVVLQEIRELNSKFDSFKLSIEQQINTKVDSLRDSVQLMIENNKTWLKEELTKKTTELQTKMQQELDNEVTLIIRRIEQMESKIDNGPGNARFNPDVSIIVSGMRYVEGESPTNLVEELLSDGLQLNTHIVAVERLADRGGRPGVIKVEFASLRDKISVLRKKQLLKDNSKYSRVFLRSAKSHAERLIELNFKTLLDELPCGRQFYIAGNGKLRRRPDSALGAGGEHGGVAAGARGAAAASGGRGLPHSGP